MKTMLNWIIIAGRLTRDPELRYTQSNTAVASFTLAVDRDYSGDREAERQTDFIDVVAWRHTGEFVSKYFQKGSGALVKGRLQLRNWTDKDGGKHRSAEIVAESVYFLGGRKDSSTAPQNDREMEQASFDGGELPF